MYNIYNNNVNINPNLSTITFKCKYETSFGEELFIMGNIEELGSWEPQKAIRMETTKEVYPLWTITNTFVCPVGMEIFYKYIVKKTNPTTNEVEILWEELPNNAPNRHIVITSSGNFDIYDEKSKLSQEVTYDINNKVNSPKSPQRCKIEEDITNNMNNNLILSPMEIQMN